MNNKKNKTPNGFTLIELIIVIAIMSVLGAIAIPNFLNTSNKARLKADIQSAIIIDNAKNMYEMESGISFDGTETAANIIKELAENSYLKKEYSTQTDKSNWVFEDKIIKLDLSNCDESIKKLYDNLTPEEKTYVKK